MRKLIFLCILLSASFTAAYAQMTAKGVSRVSERTETMSLGANTALVVQFEGISDKRVAEVWESFIKKYYDGKSEWQRKQKEWFTDNINIPAIGGATPVDLHATAQGKDNAKFSLWVNLGNSFLNSRDNYDQYKEAEKLVENFVMEVEKEKTRLDLEEQEKQLKQLEKDLEKLVSANERYHSDIEKAKEAIKKAEENIVQNKKDQEVTRQKIDNQKQVVDNVKKKMDNLR
jgi:DNA repair exonuclease SbcCD ATPase subunit